MSNASRFVVLVCALAVVLTVGWLLFREPREGSVAKPAATSSAVVDSSPVSTPESTLAQPSSASTEVAAVEPPSSRDPVNPASVESAPELATVRLTVVDSETKKPVPGAGVFSWLISNGRLIEVNGDILRTDAEGHVTLMTPTAGSCRVVVWPPEGLDGPMGEAVIESLTASRVHEQQIELPARTQLVMWVKLLTAETGIPIETATVRVNANVQNLFREQPDAPMTMKHFQGGGTGLFSVSIPSWEPHWVRMDEPTCAPILMVVEPGHETPDRARVVSMSRGAALRVNFTAPRGNRASDAVLKLACTEAFLLDSTFGTRLRWKTSLDERGLAVIDGLPAGVPLVYELTLGSRKRRPEAPIVLTAGEDRTLTLDFDVGATLAGRLVDQEGNGISWEEVWAIPAALRHAEWTACLDGFDTFVDLGGSGHAAMDASALASRSRIFVPENKLLSTATALTDRDGNFRFENVPPGVYWIGPSVFELTTPSSSSICPEAVKVEVKAAQESPLTLRVWRGRLIRGTIVNSDSSAAMAGMDGDKRGGPQYRRSESNDGTTSVISGNLPTMRLEFEAGSPPFGTLVSKDGSFKIGPLTPGDVTFRVVKYDGSVLSKFVKAKAGDTNVVLRLEPWAQLRGKIVDEDPRWPADVSVRLVGPGVRESLKSKLTGADDSFDFSQLPAGTYTLIAVTDSGKKGMLTDIQVKAGEVKSGLQILVK